MVPQSNLWANLQSKCQWKNHGNELGKGSELYCHCDGWLWRKLYLVGLIGGQHNLIFKIFFLHSFIFSDLRENLHLLPLLLFYHIAILIEVHLFGYFISWQRLVLYRAHTLSRWRWRMRASISWPALPSISTSVLGLMWLIVKSEQLKRFSHNPSLSCLLVRKKKESHRNSLCYACKVMEHLKTIYGCPDAGATVHVILYHLPCDYS